MFGEQYPEETGMTASVASQMSRPTIRQELETEKASLSERLRLVNIALDELDAHPEVATVLETISKLRGTRY